MIRALSLLQEHQPVQSCQHQQERTFVPNGLEPDSEKACAAYNEIIRSVGGIDLQLGLEQRPLGFNEPGAAAFEKRHTALT